MRNIYLSDSRDGETNKSRFYIYGRTLHFFLFMILFSCLPTFFSNFQILLSSQTSNIDLEENKNCSALM